MFDVFGNWQMVSPADNADFRWPLIKPQTPFYVSDFLKNALEWQFVLISEKLWKKCRKNHFHIEMFCIFAPEISRKSEVVLLKFQENRK